MKKIFKSNKMQLIVSLCLSFVFAVVCGYCCASAAFEMGSKNLPDIQLVKNGYEFAPSSEAAISNIETVLKADDIHYSGYISKKARLNAIVNGDSKLAQTAVLFNENVKMENFIKKTFSGDIEDDSYPIYVEGYKWRKFEAGDKVTVELENKSGEKVTVKAVICGEFLGENLPVLLDGIDVLQTGSGIFAIEGLDIKDYTENPYDRIVLFTKAPYFGIAGYGTYYDNSNLSLENMSLQLIQKKIGGSSIYLLPVLTVIFTALIFLLGGKYKSYCFGGFGTLSFIMAFLFTIIKFSKNALFAGFNYYYYVWFYALSLCVLGIFLILFAMLFALEYKKQKKINKTGEKIDATAPKYL